MRQVVLAKNEENHLKEEWENPFDLLSMQPPPRCNLFPESDRLGRARELLDDLKPPSVVNLDSLI